MSRRLAVGLTLLITWVTNTAGSWLVAAPWVELIASLGVPGHLHADTLLWQPGGLHLVELVRLSIGTFEAVALPSAALAAGTGLLRLFVLGLLVGSITSAEVLRVPQLFRLALRRWHLLLALRLLVTMVQLGLLLLGWWAGSRLALALSGTPPFSDLVLAGAVLLALALAVALGCLQDAIRIALFCEPFASALEAVRSGLETARKQALRLALTYAGLLLASGLVFVSGFLFTSDRLIFRVLPMHLGSLAVLGAQALWLFRLTAAHGAVHAARPA